MTFYTLYKKLDYFPCLGHMTMVNVKKTLFMVFICILVYLCHHNIQINKIYDNKNWKKLRKNILFLIFIDKNLHLTNYQLVAE